MMNHSLPEVESLDQLKFLEEYCREFAEEPICAAVALDNKITFDDVNYIVPIPQNDTAAIIIGRYFRIQLLSLLVGILGYDCYHYW